jgi:hypothetical protein
VNTAQGLALVNQTTANIAAGETHQEKCAKWNFFRDLLPMSFANLQGTRCERTV